MGIYGKFGSTTEVRDELARIAGEILIVNRRYREDCAEKYAVYKSILAEIEGEDLEGWRRFAAEPYTIEAALNTFKEYRNASGEEREEMPALLSEMENATQFYETIKAAKDGLREITGNFDKLGGMLREYCEGCESGYIEILNRTKGGRKPRRKKGNGVTK